ncbi:MAG: hypothetical protein IPJ03_16605 [Ignavibacteriales bacterium]|nr:hypothetical protein [Ignavibacteriales bacterium]
MTTLTKLNGSTSYVRMSDLKEGEVIVEKGRLVDVQAGKFGDTLIFMEEKDSKRVGLGMGGFLKSMYEKQVFKMGDTLRITYKGKKKLKDGRQANDFDLERYETEQVSLFSDTDDAEVSE